MRRLGLVTLSERDYLRAMFTVVKTAGLEAAAAEGNVGVLGLAYQRCLNGFKHLLPPPELKHPHSEILEVCEGMIRALSSVVEINQLTDRESVQDFAKRGALAFGALQEAADRLGLGISFRRL